MARGFWVKELIQLIPAAVSLALVMSVPAQAGEKGPVEAQGKILVHASPSIVWRVVHEEREHDPDLAYSHVVERGQNQETIEQKFIGLPFLGAVTTLTRHLEAPFKRIDYILIRSDKLKDLHGSWQFTPLDGGRSTELSLRSALDIGVPFSGFFIRNATQKKINRRLSNIKEIAEKETRLAGTPEHGTRL